MNSKFFLIIFEDGAISYVDSVGDSELDGAAQGFVDLVAIVPGEPPKQYDPESDSWTEIYKAIP